MPKAVIKGEIHLSNSDQKQLEELSEQDFDAGFFEGVKDEFPREQYSFTMIPFIFGRLIHKFFGDRQFGSLEGTLENLDDTHFVDCTILEQYKQVGYWKHWLIFLLSIFTGVMFFGGLIALPVQKYVSTGAAGFILLFTFVVISLLHFVYVVFESLAYRDKLMAENIMEITGEEGYEKVLLNFGGSHAPGIAKILENNGWNVEVKGWRAKFHFDRFLSTLIRYTFSPWKSYKYRPSKIEF
jgi:hypothetical protein